ncbi:MAG: Asd/ArgC dimerization domain-containing protein [Bryobacteraceae bacterium]
MCATARPPLELSLIAETEEETGRLTGKEGEPTVVQRLSRVTLTDADVTFLAGSRESTRLAVGIGAGTTFVDLTYGADDHPRTRLRAPAVERGQPRPEAGAIHVIAHPAAIALTLALGRMQSAIPISRAVAHVFEPASERGSEGLEELQTQTVNLLAFKTLPKKVYDAQVSFNLLARLGEDAPEALQDIELRLDRHLATLLAPFGAPMPSVRVIQAPVFHGHSFSLWVEFERNPAVKELERLLQSSEIDVRGGDAEPPNIVGVAGQSGIAAGAVSVDRNNSKAAWIWLAADNLRLMADNAVAVAQELL